MFSSVSDSSQLNTPFRVLNSFSMASCYFFRPFPAKRFVRLGHYHRALFIARYLKKAALVFSVTEIVSCFHS